MQLKVQKKYVELVNVKTRYETFSFSMDIADKI